MYSAWLAIRPGCCCCCCAFVFWFDDDESLDDMLVVFAFVLCLCYFLSRKIAVLIGGVTVS
jgi:hypothetical protein